MKDMKVVVQIMAYTGYSLEKAIDTVENLKRDPCTVEAFKMGWYAGMDTAGHRLNECTIDAMNADRQASVLDKTS